MHTALLTHGAFMRTLEVDGQVAAVLGLRVRWAGVGDCWAVVGNSARGHGLWLTRTCRSLLNQFSFELGLHRVGISVKATQAENLRWAKRLGFEFEGVEALAGPEGEDLIRMVRWTVVPKNTRQ